MNTPGKGRINDVPVIRMHDELVLNKCRHLWFLKCQSTDLLLLNILLNMDDNDKKDIHINTFSAESGVVITC